jgi:hypothetical protein
MQYNQRLSKVGKKSLVNSQKSLGKMMKIPLFLRQGPFSATVRPGRATRPRGADPFQKMLEPRMDAKLKGLQIVDRGCTRLFFYL